EVILTNILSKHGGIQNMVFHPSFGQDVGKDYLYVYYVHRPDDAGASAPYYDRLSRFTWNGTHFGEESELILINQYDVSRGHDGSGLAFGSDGFLYVTVGDEGTQNAAATPHVQKINDRFRSGVWRIDVDQQGGSISHPIRRQPKQSTVPAGWDNSYTQGYFVPYGNPWDNPDGSVLDEYYALGLRNPFRMTYDSPTNTFWIGDVGGSGGEEINLMDKPGLNFMWNYAAGPGLTGFSPVPNPLIGEERPPLHHYNFSGGRAVIGGYIYRGDKIPSLRGKYIYGDNVKTSIHAISLNESLENQGAETLVTVGGGRLFSGISSFGLTHSGELLVLKLSGGIAGVGKIYRIAPKLVTDVSEMPTTLSQTGVFSDLSGLVPSNGFIPYDVNTPLWTAGTLKKRWIALPNDGQIDTVDERITYSETGPWGFPIGTVLVKHFGMPSGKKLETRIWIHGEDGIWFGASYKWRENGAEADLLIEGGTETLQIDGESFTYQYPSSSQCYDCHNQISGWVLGFKTSQLNGNAYYPTTGRTANQLETLGHLGFIPQLNTDNVLTSVAVDDHSQSLEIRARSYLDANCAHCHQPSANEAFFDARLGTPLTNQGLINGKIKSELYDYGDLVIAKGDVGRSALHNRMNTMDSEAAMPPLAKGRIDREAVQLIHNWITSLEADCGAQTESGVLGNAPVADASFVDAHSPIMMVNRTDGYENTGNGTLKICVGNFEFFAKRLGNPVTPILAKVKGENDFQVVAIGETRTPNDYVVGSNSFNFSDAFNTTIVLAPGEKLVPGFMDANPDGSGGEQGKGVIPAVVGTGQDDIWTTYNTGTHPSVRLGLPPIQGLGVRNHLSRSYQFAIDFTIADVQERTNLALNKPTQQSSTGYGGHSEKVVDGNRNGVHSAG
ncbi:MAG: PQQ-dependent sugar dehydrogenase, partial [Flavobacteriaceae bacterium]